MAIVEKISQDEMDFLEVVSNPVMFAEFENNIDIPDGGEEWILTYYQKDFICDFNNYVSLCCGRAVGKTQSLTEIILWNMINKVYGNDYIVYVVPNKVHLDPVFTNLTVKLRSNTFLKNFIDAKKGINSSSHKITMNNGTVLDCRIAGQSGTGANVVGIHSPHIIVDESAYFPIGTWVELQPTLNKWTPGFRLIVSGVPDGKREDSVTFYCDMVDENFTKHRVSAHQNPRYSKEDDEKNIIQYGGVDSDDYVHMVLGEHGNPTYSVFDRNLLGFETYPVLRLTLDGSDIQSNLSIYFNKLSFLPSLPDGAKFCVFGIDLGYTDPTAIVILWQDKHGTFRFHSRIRLNKVPYPVQEKIIDYLDNMYKPAVLGIDEGSAGKSTIHHLLYDDNYIHKNYQKRLVPISFGSSISIGKNEDGEDVNEKVKPYSVSVLQEYSNSHKIIYSTTDMDLVSELERMAYTKTQLGELVYRTMTVRGSDRGQDHFTAALLCASLAYHQTNELLIAVKSKRLISPRWLYGNVG